jgi:hypothetical protein
MKYFSVEFNEKTIGASNISLYGESNSEMNQSIRSEL